MAPNQNTSFDERARLERHLEDADASVRMEGLNPDSLFARMLFRDLLDGTKTFSEITQEAIEKYRRE